MSKKHKRSNVPPTLSKSQLKIKDEKERFAVNVIYMMELFKDALLLLQKRGHLAKFPELEYITKIREDTLMKVLLFTIGVEKSYIAKISDILKSNPTRWMKEVESFAERNYGSKRLKLVTLDEFEKELADVSKRKSEQERLVTKGGILVNPK